MEMYSADAYMVSFFREPRAQVYSLFVQALRDRLCTALVLKPTDLVHVEFSKWVDHFYKGLQPNGSMAEKNCFGCYHPYNMQVSCFYALHLLSA